MRRRAGGTATIVYGAGVAGIVLALMEWWFAFSNRHVVFLYQHRDNGRPPAQPFDPTTLGRYWMSGLVAAGVVAFVAACVWLLFTRRASAPAGLAPPRWWRAWAAAAPLLVIGIPAITLTQNHPTMPLDVTARVAASGIVGTGLALVAVEEFVAAPSETAWLALDASGLLPALLFLRALELPYMGMLPAPAAWLVAVGSVAAGLVWLFGAGLARARFSQPEPGTRRLVLAGLWLNLIAVPIAHHLLFAPPAYRYITSAANVFGYYPVTWPLSIVVAAGVAWCGVRWRRRVAGSRAWELA